MDKKLSVVIPCYNAGRNIESVIQKDREIFKKQHIENYEFILVNDCSKDNTWEVLKTLSVQMTNVISVNLAKNSGQHGAIMAGFHYVSGDYIVVSDDDGQTPMKAIGQMLEKIEDGYDIVTTEWITKSKRSVVRRLGTKISDWMNRVLLGAPQGIVLSIFFAARRFIIDEMIKYDNPYPYITGLLIRTSHNIGTVKVEQLDRQSGESGYSFHKLLSLWLNGFTAFSVLPLRVTTFIGVLSAVFGFLYGLYILIRKLFIDNIAPGWSSTIAVILFMSGVILCVLGLIGEYIGRIYICLNNSPQFVIKEIINDKYQLNEQTNGRNL
jgi:undecaprenyl-phosphate 4-deoxy-4-formamido-L-arabinose transferase